MNKVERCGAVGKKLGMTQIFTDNGQVLPVTLLEFEKNVVVACKKEEIHGYDAIVIGYGRAKQNKISKPLKGILAAVGISDVKGLKEFRISKEYFREIGEEIAIEHFSLGQYVDVVGSSIGKGFAGAMKRHNFAGLEATHGVSVSHRAHGSTGNRTLPGKVFKGKKMAGHLGAERVTAQNLQVVDVNKELNVLAVLGCVPGSKGSRVFIKDAVKKALPVLVLESME